MLWLLAFPDSLVVVMPNDKRWALWNMNDGHSYSLSFADRKAPRIAEGTDRSLIRSEANVRA